MATSPPSQPGTVLVLGAGMSGLVAAYELMIAGYNVTVLEGRDVPGGRVQTIRDGFTPSRYAEAGAMFLPGDHTLTQKYAATFGVPLQDFTLDLADIYYLQGQRIVDPPPAGAPPTQWPYNVTPFEQKLGYSGMNKVYCQAGLSSTTVSAQWPPATEAVFDQISYATRMEGLGASIGAQIMLSKGYLSMYGEGPGSYSALMMMYDLWYTDLHPGAFQVPGGNDIYPKMMAAALGNRVQYGATIMAIARDSDKVRVTVQSPSGAQQVVEGDYAICALPFTVLRDLPVSPALSPERLAALRSTPCTSATRVCMEFQRPFWLDEGLNGLVITDLPIGITYPQPGEPGPSAVLNQLMIGDNARLMAARSEEDRLKYTLAEISKYFPQAPATYVGGASKVWDSDPWAKGAYAYYGPLQMSKYLPIFQNAEGRLHFAGDYMSLLPGWIEGALNSGIRAAAEVASASGGKPVHTPAADAAAAGS